MDDPAHEGMYSVARNHGTLFNAATVGLVQIPYRRRHVHASASRRVCNPGFSFVGGHGKTHLPLGFTVCGLRWSFCIRCRDLLIFMFTV